MTSRHEDDTSVSFQPNRRRWLQLTGAGCLGVNLPLLWQAQTASAARPATPQSGAQIKACIVLFYYGGPPHLDTFDLKPNAPAEIRGEFKPVPTAVPGLHISEHLPHTARVMNKVALVRSMRHPMRNHDSACAETLSGRTPPGGDKENFAAVSESGAYPNVGAALSYVCRGRAVKLPHAALPFLIHNVVTVPGQQGGFLGAAFNPFLIHGDPETLTYQAEMLRLPETVTAGRLNQRRDLLAAVARGEVRAEGKAAPLRAFYDKAFDLLGSEAVRRALDIGQEPRRVRERYGLDLPPESLREKLTGGNGAENGVGRKLRGQNLLLARRLVEAGVPFVSIYDYRQQGQNWDNHTRNFSQLKDHLLPPADRAFAALVEDLHERGLLETTLVVALGEFGRTPRINKDAGRDHWPDCYSALLAGGGVQGGAVYGASDKIGAYPAADPVTPADLAATIFWRFGVDPATEVHDLTGRPFKVAEGEPLRRLFP